MEFQFVNISVSNFDKLSTIAAHARQDCRDVYTESAMYARILGHFFKTVNLTDREAEISRIETTAGSACQVTASLGLYLLKSEQDAFDTLYDWTLIRPQTSQAVLDALLEKWLKQFVTTGDCLNLGHEINRIVNDVKELKYDVREFTASMVFDCAEDIHDINDALEWEGLPVQELFTCANMAEPDFCPVVVNVPSHAAKSLVDFQVRTNRTRHAWLETLFDMHQLR